MSDASKRFLPLEELSSRIRWLINLRWITIVCLFIIITATRYLPGIKLSGAALYGANLLLLLSNASYTVVYRKLRQVDPGTWKVKSTNFFINFQITFDLLLLTLLLHFSGGSENPFSLFYIFHMVIASILLSNRAAYLQAFVAVSLFGFMVFGELSGLLPHLHIRGYIPDEPLHQNVFYALGIFSAISVTLYVTVYMTTSIVNTLRKREAELERVIGKLETANRTLEHKDREKSMYVQTVSHDIKGSLTAIQSCLKVVLEGMVGVVASKLRDMIQRAERRSRGLLRFVDELLFLSTIRAENGMQRTEKKLSGLVKDICNELEPVVSAKGIELTVEDNSGQSTIRADSDAIHQLLSQILDNALKYTGKGGTIRIKLWESAKPACVITSISDTGIGIDDDDLPYIYDDFYSADIPINREIPSTGLGLAIARQIMKMHDGQIEVESKLGKGSTFQLTFPVLPNTTEED
jgi:two-component system phosphate regulon sensor histidine kinase PhoR